MKNHEKHLLVSLSIHHNVIKFIREITVNDCVGRRLALVTRYYELGSLSSYLREHEMKKKNYQKWQRLQPVVSNFYMKMELYTKTSDRAMYSLRMVSSIVWSQTLLTPHVNKTCELVTLLVTLTETASSHMNYCRKTSIWKNFI